MKICSLVNKVSLMVMVTCVGLLLPCLSVAADQEDPHEDAVLQQVLALQAQLDQINTRVQDRIFIPFSPFMTDVWKEMPPTLLWQIVHEVVPELKVLPQELDAAIERGREIERTLKR